MWMIMVTILFDLPTEYEDGGPLPSEEIQAMEIFCGGNLIKEMTAEEALSGRVSFELQKDEWCAGRVKASDVWSRFSEEILVRVTSRPKPPTLTGVE